MGGYPSAVHGRQCVGVVALTLAHTPCDFAAVLGSPTKTHGACPRTHVQTVFGSHLA